MDAELKAICRIIDRIGAWTVFVVHTARGVKLGEISPPAVAYDFFRNDRGEERK